MAVPQPSLHHRVLVAVLFVFVAITLAKLRSWNVLCPKAMSALTMIDISVVCNNLSLNRRTSDDLRLRWRRRGTWTGRRSPLTFPLNDPEPAPLKLRWRQRPRRRRPLPLDNSRARAFHDGGWAGRTVRSLDNTCAETHSVHGRPSAGAPYALSRVIDDPRADLLPFTNLWWWRWWRRSGAHAPCPCLGDNALPHNGRRRSWPGPSSLDCLDIALAQDQGACLRWSTGFFTHEMGHPGLALYLFPHGDLNIASPCHGRRGCA